MNPSHDNTQDSADLEIARLKAELEEAKERVWAGDGFWRDAKAETARVLTQLADKGAELSRLTEENKQLRESVRVHGAHVPRCPAVIGAECECGFSAAWAIAHASGDSE